MKPNKPKLTLRQKDKVTMIHISTPPETLSLELSSEIALQVTPEKFDDKER
jgi:hypothetical protein